VFEAVEITEGDFDSIQEENVNDIDPASLCVIKCLKPVSERKIKRELLVLSHASKLPNLARLKAVVVPTPTSGDSTDSDGDGGKMPSIILKHA